MGELDKLNSNLYRASYAKSLSAGINFTDNDDDARRGYLLAVLPIINGYVGTWRPVSNFPHHRAQQSGHGMVVSEITLPLLTAFQRLIDLPDEEHNILILAPIIQKEIMNHLLVGEQGARLRQIASAGSQSQQIARAIEWLKYNLTQQLRIDDLASWHAWERLHFITISGP